MFDFMRKGFEMAYTDWPKIIQEINQKYGTEFKPRTKPARRCKVPDLSIIMAAPLKAGTAAVSQTVMYAMRNTASKPCTNSARKYPGRNALIRINAILETPPIDGRFRPGTPSDHRQGRRL